MNHNTLVFASANANKVAEIESKLGGSLKLSGLLDIGCLVELPETTGTIPGNAQQKAEYVYDHFQVNCFADDTGLEVEALGGEPGVDSADYAHAGRNAEANMQLLLKNLEGQSNRNARFRTVICLYWDGAKHLFEGIAEGQILTSPRGTQGFGYDPIFLPNGYDLSFAEMNLQQKNEYSHRAKAIGQLKAFLEQQNVQISDR